MTRVVINGDECYGGHRQDYLKNYVHRTADNRYMTKIVDGVFN